MFPMRSLAIVFVLCLLAACGSSEPETPAEVYDLHGEVVRLDTENQVAVIKHEDIDGWMKAMTMDFPVKDAAEFEKLSPGATIDAKVHVQDLDFWLADIEVQ